MAWPKGEDQREVLTGSEYYAEKPEPAYEVTETGVVDKGYAVKFEYAIMVQVYLDNGIVYEYEVSDAIKGREHAAAIIATGYRHSDGDNLEWFPPHRLVKVKVTDGAETTKYRDNARAT